MFYQSPSTRKSYNLFLKKLSIIIYYKKNRSASPNHDFCSEMYQNFFLNIISYIHDTYSTNLINLFIV